MDLESVLSKRCPGFLKPLLCRVQSSPVGYRIARGMFWSLAGAAISRGIMLAAWILVARVLGRVAYGELGMVQSTVGLFGVFAGFGLGITATKHVAQYRASNPQRAGWIIGLSEVFAIGSGTLISLVLLIFAPWIAAHTINAPHLTGCLRVGSLVLFFSALNGAQIGSLSGLEAFRTLAFVNLIVGFLSFPILLAGAYFGGLTGAVWALVVTLCVNSLANHLALRKEANELDIPITIKSCLREGSILWKFSVPAFLAGAMVGPVNWLCRALLVNRPSGYEEMGLLNAADQWQTMMLFVPTLLSAVILPVLSERLSRGDLAGSRQTIRGAIKINLCLVVPVSILASIVSPYIMGFYGNGFREGWPTLVMVLLATVFMAVIMPANQVLAALGKMWIGLILNVVWAIVIILGTISFLDLGSLGLASARAGGYALHSILVFVCVLYFLNKAERKGPQTI